MKLTEHFSLYELTRSVTASKNGIDNTPGENETKRLKALCENILEPLRVAYGSPINVTSGYRCQELNAMVGGSKTSDHKYGCAADLVVYKRDKNGAVVFDKKNNPVTDKEGNQRLFELCISLGLPFKQLINEYDFSWVHVSYQAEITKHQILKITE